MIVADRTKASNEEKRRWCMIRHRHTHRDRDSGTDRNRRIDIAGAHTETPGATMEQQRRAHGAPHTASNVPPGGDVGCDGSRRKFTYASRVRVNTYVNVVHAHLCPSICERACLCSCFSIETDRLA